MTDLEIKAVNEVKNIVTSIDTFPAYRAVLKACEESSVDSKPILDALQNETSNINRTVTRALGWIDVLLKNQ